MKIETDEWTALTAGIVGVAMVVIVWIYMGYTTSADVSKAAIKAGLVQQNDRVQSTHWGK